MLFRSLQPRAPSEAVDLCENCGQPLRLERGVEVGNIFKLGTRYSDSLGCTYTDKDGNLQPVIMGSYGIGVGRLLACAVEEHHDEKGLKLPLSIAPFAVHMVVLPGKQLDVAPVVRRIEQDLLKAGIEPLIDDREESAGVKFNDADLIGCPLRVTISERALRSGSVELKKRSGGEAWLTPLENGVQEILNTLNQIREQESVKLPHD